MAFDPDTLPAATKRSYIELGEQFGSEDTLAQANQTLNLRPRFAPLLAQHGFADIDWDRLSDARDLVIEAGVGREGAKGDKKTTSKAFVAAATAAQSARLSARSVLWGAHEALDESGDEKSAQQVATVLAQTSATPDEPERLAAQLDGLRKALTVTEVATAAAKRGGPDSVARLQTAATALREADKADTRVRGTPEETARLDLLDGIIVRLVRRARKAAIAAGKATGNAAVGKEFRLDKLYRGRGGKAAAEVSDEGDEGEDQGGEEK